MLATYFHVETRGDEPLHTEVAHVAERAEQTHPSAFSLSEAQQGNHP
jgi:hypothetical protein